MASYNIIVHNKTQQQHKYIVTSEPVNTAADFSSVRTCVIASASLPPDGEAQFKIDRPNPYYAYAMAFYQTDGPGANVTTRSKKPVQLGQAKPDGTLVPGTSVQFRVLDGTPNLETSSVTPKDNTKFFPKSFEIRTGSEFSTDDVANGKLNSASLGQGKRTNIMGIVVNRELLYWLRRQESAVHVGPTKF